MHVAELTRAAAWPASRSRSRPSATSARRGSPGASRLPIRPPEDRPTTACARSGMPSPAACAWRRPDRRRPGPLPHLVHPPRRAAHQRGHGIFRWSSPSTRSSRCAVEAGAARPAGTTCPPGSSGPRSSRRTPWSPSSSGTREDVLRHFDVEPEAGAHHPQRHRRRVLRPDPETEALERYGSRPSAVRPVRGPHHPPEGDRPPGARDPAPRPRDRGRPGRRAARHARARGRGRGPVAERRGANERRLDPRDAEPRGDPQLYSHARRLRLPIGLRAVRDHQPRGDGLRDAGRGQAVGGSPRSWSTARPGILVPVAFDRTSRWPRPTPTGFAATWPPPSTR